MKEIILEAIKKTFFYDLVRKKLYETDARDYKQSIMEAEETNDFFEELLTTDKPTMVSRIGSTELHILKQSRFRRNYTKQIYRTALNYSGIFPADKETLDKFSQTYFASIPKIDLLGVWFNPFEDKVANEFCPNAKLTKLRNLEPYFSKKPWSFYLKNKKVLVVHPFTTSIENQYKKREQLFQDKRILPEFELITYKAIQSLGGNDEFLNWFEALEYMKKEITEIDFDIAVIGAGAYGLPLAAHIKDIGKKAVHLGGATQMLFGVSGRRWELLPDFKDIINDAWSKPIDEERAKTAQKVENACYW